MDETCGSDSNEYLGVGFRIFLSLKSNNTYHIDIFYFLDDTILLKYDFVFDYLLGNYDGDFWPTKFTYMKWYTCNCLLNAYEHVYSVIEEIKKYEYAVDSQKYLQIVKEFHKMQNSSITNYL